MAERRASAIASALAPGLFVALPAAPWLFEAMLRASWAPLGRDQGIFQYAAWAIANGARAYRDVRDVNGPLVLLVHTVLQALGGQDEHVFRTLDLAFVALASTFAGACLVALAPSLPDRRARIARAATLGLASWAILTTQYVAYGSWDTAQRESFFDLFVLVSMGAQMLGQATPNTRRRAALLALAGAASLAPWLGKPTYALVTAGQVLALVLDGRGRMRRVAVFAGGGVLGAAAPFAFLVARGDVDAWAHITFVDVPAMYRFIWPRSVAGILRLHVDASTLAIVASAGVLALVIARRMPVRALPIALFPLAGLGSALIQAKGFLYHFHPVTLGAHLALLALAHHAWAFAEARRPRLTPRLVAGAFAILLGGRTAAFAARAATFYLPAPTSAADAESDERLASYTRVDFFPIAMRRASELLARATRPGDTVQVYGMDPYILFTAKRRSATPYIYAYDLDADAALAGSFEPGGARPTEAQAARIQAIRDEHERDLVARVEAAPPAAFVFIGRAPLMVQPDAFRDFEDHCPDAAAFVLLRYREVAVFDDVRVWMRNDIEFDSP